jgi:hypothetical protein
MNSAPPPFPYLAIIPPRRVCTAALKIATLLALAGLVFVIVALAGCTWFAQPTPATPRDLAVQRVTQDLEAYLLVTAPIDAAIASGDIKGDAARDITAAEGVALSYLDAARAAAKTGELVDVDTQLALFENARAALIAAFAKTKTPATAPRPPGGTP